MEILSPGDRDFLGAIEGYDSQLAITGSVIAKFADMIITRNLEQTKREAISANLNVIIYEIRAQHEQMLLGISGKISASAQMIENYSALVSLAISSGFPDHALVLSKDLMNYMDLTGGVIKSHNWHRSGGTFNIEQS